MAIIIETRTRALVTDTWGAWSNLPVDAVTDGTFTNGDLVEYRVQGDITISDVTDNVVEANDTVTGDGVFDDLMETVTKHLDVQFKQDRIKGTEYATVYLGALQSTIAEATKFVLQKGIAANQAQTELAKTGLVLRQTKGFDDDAKQKLAKQMMDTWAVAYSVAQDANSIPDAIKVNPIDSVIKDAMDSLGMTVTVDPLAQV